MQNVQTPLLCVNALDDPIAPKVWCKGGGGGPAKYTGRTSCQLTSTPPTLCERLGQPHCTQGAASGGRGGGGKGTAWFDASLSTLTALLSVCERLGQPLSTQGGLSVGAEFA